MDIGNISSVASAVSDMSQAKTGDAVALAVLKKAMNIEAQGAAALIQALPQPASNNPPNLGQHVDAFA